jgi:hypothetical protein
MWMTDRQAGTQADRNGTTRSGGMFSRTPILGCVQQSRSNYVTNWRMNALGIPPLLYQIHQMLDAEHSQFRTQCSKSHLLLT